jgi:hypothetical protein
VGIPVGQVQGLESLDPPIQAVELVAQAPDGKGGQVEQIGQSK